MATAEGRTGSASDVDGWPSFCPMAACKVPMVVMAPRPSEGWSAAPTPNEGNVTVPAITTVCW